jgi:hypothetical protein
MIHNDNDGVYQEIVDRILLDPKNVSTPKELHQQANACLRALESSDINHDGIISTDEIGKLSELMGLPVNTAEDAEGESNQYDQTDSATLSILFLQHT